MSISAEEVLLTLSSSTGGGNSHKSGWIEIPSVGMSSNTTTSSSSSSSSSGNNGQGVGGRSAGGGITNGISSGSYGGNSSSGRGGTNSSGNGGDGIGSDLDVLMGLDDPAYSYTEKPPHPPSTSTSTPASPSATMTESMSMSSLIEQQRQAEKLAVVSGIGTLRPGFTGPLEKLGARMN